MPVIRMRAPLSGAHLMIFSGRVTEDELLGQFGAIDETLDESSHDWLTLDLGFADISELSFDVLIKLKAILAPKLAVMKARRFFEVCIVSLRPLNDPIYMAWQSFVGEDEDYPSHPLFYSDLNSMCDYLGYGEAERTELFNLCAAVR